MLCQGQTLQVTQNQALYSILGTTYGGNGQTTFQLPDLRSRVPVGTGLGQGLSTNVTLGSKIGSETNVFPFTGVQPAVAGGPVSTVVTGGIPVNNREPSLGLNYIICIQGLYPVRD
jgi:microcystin-dependent protein